MTCPAAWSTVWSTKPTITATRASSRGRQALLLGGADRAEQDLGIAEQLLQLVHGAAAAGIEVAEAVGHRAGIGSEAAGVVAQEPFQLGPDVGDAEHGVGGDLVQADPQQQLVLGEAPVLGEGLDGRREDLDLAARRAGERQVVLAEGTAGQTADHRPDGHAEHRRRDEPEELTEHGQALVVVDVVGRERLDVDGS